MHNKKKCHSQQLQMKNQILLIFNSKKLFGIKTKCRLIEKMIIKITAHAIIVLRCIKMFPKKNTENLGSQIK